MGIILYAPVKYGFKYPSASDNPGNYIQALEKSEPIRNFAAYLIKPLNRYIQDYSMSMSILYFLIMVAVTITTFIIFRSMGGLMSFLATFNLILGFSGVWLYYHWGYGFQLGGLLIFTASLYLFIEKYYSSHNRLYLLPVFILCILTLMFHRYTGMITTATVLMLATMQKDWKLLIVGLSNLFVAGTFIYLSGPGDYSYWVFLSLTGFEIRAAIIWFTSISLILYATREHIMKLSPLLQLWTYRLGLVLILNFSFVNALRQRAYHEMVLLISILALFALHRLLNSKDRGLAYIIMGLLTITTVVWLKPTWLSDYEATAMTEGMKESLGIMAEKP